MTVDEIKALQASLRMWGDKGEYRSGDLSRTRDADATMCRAVLSAIADGTCADPQACAAQALRTWE